MSSVTHPRAKKDASLKRDHRVYPWEGDKTSRGAFKAKKRRKASQDRFTAKTAIQKAAGGCEEAASARMKQPKSLVKSGVASLARDLEIKRSEPQMRFASFSYSNGEFTR